jgi:hypothetical protein
MITAEEIRKRLTDVSPDIDCLMYTACPEIEDCNKCPWKGWQEVDMLDRALDAEGLPVAKDSDKAVYRLAVVTMRHDEGTIWSTIL